jgi:hypothetical protein
LLTVVVGYKNLSENCYEDNSAPCNEHKDKRGFSNNASDNVQFKNASHSGNSEINDNNVDL